MKRLLIIIVVLAQLAVLVSMAGQREWILRHGRHILLRTAPVDPTDYMRGQYARLNYDISNIPEKLFRDDLRNWKYQTGRYQAHRDARVYAMLEVEPDGYAHLTGLTDREPTSGVFLRGRIGSFYPHSASVRYGIEALFMEEGEAAKFEQAPRTDRTPIDAEIAVSPNGTGMITTTHHEALGMSIKTEREAYHKSDGEPQTHILDGITVTLTNQSQAPVSIVLRPNGRSFRLIPAVGFGDEGYAWVNETAPLAAPVSTDFQVLAPGASISQHIDFKDPYWAVVRPGAPEKKLPAEKIQLTELGAIWGHSYRLEYTPGIQFSDAASHTPAVSTRTIASRLFTTAGTD